MDEDKLKQTVRNAVLSKDTVELLKYFIDKSSCFRQGLAKDEKQEIYNRGYGDFGLHIRELLLNYAPEIYIEIIQKGVEENERSNN